VVLVGPMKNDRNKANYASLLPSVRILVYNKNSTL
jgi:hypothetical protein